MAKRIVIKDGMAAGFADEMSLPLTNIEKERVSVIVPRNPLLWVLFAVIRSLAPEDSQAAEWTRTWACDWDVKIDQETHGPFQDRAEAIRFEKSRIQDSGKIDRFLQMGRVIPVAKQ